MGSWCKLGTLPYDFATLEPRRALEAVIPQLRNLGALKPLKPTTFLEPCNLGTWNPATLESCNIATAGSHSCVNIIYSLHLMSI